MEQQKIWSHFQNRRLEVFESAEPRYRFLARQALEGRVLNIGVGNGGFERLAAEMGREVHSLDPDAETLTKITSVNKGTAGTAVCLFIGRV